MWYDDFTIVWGDSIRGKIDEGLRYSKYGIVVLSEAFFRKKWTQNELSALFAQESGENIILPIWHDISKEDIKKYSPMLADRRALSSDIGLDQIVQELIKKLKKSNC